MLDKHCASETYTQPWIKAFEFLKFLCRTCVSPPSESLQGWGRDMVTQRYFLPRPRYIYCIQPQWANRLGLLFLKIPQAEDSLGRAASCFHLYSSTSCSCFLSRSQRLSAQRKILNKSPKLGIFPNKQGWWSFIEITNGCGRASAMRDSRLEWATV